MTRRRLEHNRRNHDHHHPSRNASFASIALLLLIVLLVDTRTVRAQDAAGSGTENQTSDESNLPRDFLTNDSVVLVTGAAGFLGSSLALALHRTYQPRKIVCVDRMNPHPQSQEELALLEFQRQRTFSVMQTLGSVGQFWRVDVRPSMPEYFDLGEVPVLDHIFREHPDITHVVHLADPSAHPQSPLQQIIPREKDNPKAGMMEALLEQILKIQREEPDRSLPHFVFASSSDVYPRQSSPEAARQPLLEVQTITTPRSFRGASKLMDEMLCKLYYDLHGLYSVGLRFFSVYGPWGVPGTPLFELAERAVTGEADLLSGSFAADEIDAISDYVYIDDAVNAMMAAMQFRPQEDEKPHPVIFNVATETGSSIRDVASIMQKYFPGETKAGDAATARQSTASKNIAIGSIERANTYLGYKPRTSLEDGIIQLLAWHYDRAFPYGGRPGEMDEKSQFISEKGIVSCLPYDEECLKGAPVFPCSSECSHERQCRSSVYDPIVGWAQTLTRKCKTVLYTVDFNDSLEFIPSTKAQIQDNSVPFVSGDCNLAFVSESSTLVQSMRGRNILLRILTGGNRLLRHGRWILIPLPIASVASADREILRLLPKLSPGLFFGPKTKRAIYIDPNLLLHSIPKLLEEASVQPYMEDVEGATAMLIGRGVPNSSFFASTDENDIFDAPDSPQVLPTVETAVQNAAYRMVRIAVKDQLFGDGNFMDLLDSRWLVHTLQSDDSRLFRCDVYGEVLQWKVDSDRSALEFVLGLHDMWSRVLAKQSLNVDPWWVGDGVQTVREGNKPHSASKYNKHRRLDEVVAIVGKKAAAAKPDHTKKKGQQAPGKDGNQQNDKPAADDEGDDDDEDENENGDDSEDSAPEAKQENAVEEERGLDDDEVVEKVDENVETMTVEEVFGGEAKDKEVVAADNKERGDSSSEMDDDIIPFNQEEYDGDGSPLLQRDYSAYDAWMGVLSATSKYYFVRIVPSSEVGVISYEELLSQQHTEE